jgi:two-component system, OmpR family, aerobic respiration control sensor histidine kinase ArcB
MSNETKDIRYKVSFTNASAEQKKSFKDSRCIITISVGQPPHEGEKFQATLDLVNKSFKGCMIAVCDTLQRNSRAITKANKTPEDLYEISKKEGDKWLERNKKAIESLTIPCRISRWDEWLNHKDFKDYQKKVDELYENDKEYAKSLNTAIGDYLERVFNHNNIKDISSEGEKWCLKYLKEECAAMCLWFYENYEFDLYSSGRKQAFSMTYEKLIPSQYQRFSAPIGLRFKKSENKVNISTENILANLPGHVYWKDKDGVYLGCNNKQARSLGQKQGLEIIDKTDCDLLGSEIGNKIRENDLLIMKTGQSEVIEEDTYIKKKKKVTMISHKSPLRDAEGHIIGVIGMSIDMTQQKLKEKNLLIQTKERKVALENILANLPGHIYWKDKDGVYLGCNDKQVRSLGLKQESEIIGKIDSDLPWGEDASNKIMHNDKLIIQTGRTELIEEAVKINNKNHTFLSQKAPLKDFDGNNIGVIGVSVDISYQKRLEQKYIEKTAKLKEALKGRRDFINKLSHEIKTPLHGITSITKEVYEQWDKLESKQKKDYLKTVVDSQDRLMSLVTKLLDLAKLKSGKSALKFNENNLKELVKCVISEFKYITEPIIVEVSPQLNTIVQCDSLRIQQVIRNFISNAVKYGGKDKPISIRIASTNHGFLKVSVVDRGIGIPSKEIKRIFDPFEESSITKQVAGTGLGLAICRDIIDSHRGEIWAERNQERGSTFVFTIPMERPERKKHILVIDDEVSVLQSTFLMLTDLDYEVITFESGAEAMNYLEENGPVDLILLDLLIQDMSGADILKHLKEDESFKSIPVIMQTGIDDQENLRKLLKLGASDYITKPYCKEKLRVNIEKHL